MLKHLCVFPRDRNGIPTKNSFLKVFLYSSLPFSVVPRRMNYGRNHDSLLTLEYFVNDSVRKALRIPPANILSRVLAAAAVIPRSNLDNVLLCFRSCNNLPIHCFVLDRRRSFNVSRGSDDVGSFRWAAKRNSTRVSSASDRGGSSNSITRRMRSCRSSKVKLGSASRS